jgi:hypothetical protein
VFSFVLQQKDDEINQLKKETTRLNKVRETIQRRLRQSKTQLVESILVLSQLDIIIPNYMALIIIEKK